MSRPRLIPVTPNASYRVSAAFKTAGVQNKARLAVSFYNTSAVYMSSLLGPTISGTSDCTFLLSMSAEEGVACRPPPGAGFMRVEFRIYGRGTLGIDDVVVH